MNAIEALQQACTELFEDLGPMHAMVARYCLACQIARMWRGGFEDHLNDYSARWLVLAAVLAPANAPEFASVALARAREMHDAKAAAILEDWLRTYYPERDVDTPRSSSRS